MTNADKFRSIFGIYATEMWSKSEEEFLEWLNSETEEQEKGGAMDDLISRQVAIELIHSLYTSAPIMRRNRELWEKKYKPYIEAEKALEMLPSAQPERKKGKWIEKHHAYSDEEAVIEEWQSCRCSECGRYDTRPYMYYFSEPNYCSYCGAYMRGE